jgi:PilZ domain
MSADLFERRQAERRCTKSFLDYEAVSPQGATLARGLARTLNVSATGLLLETGRFFEVGQLLLLTVVLANELVQLTGRVVHSQPIDDDLCCSGIQFVTFSGDSAQRFQRYCASLGSLLEP